VILAMTREISYQARLARQTKNYLVYEYGANLEGKPFQFYVPKTDLEGTPTKLVLKLDQEVEPAHV